MTEITARQGYYLTQSAEVTDRIYVTRIKGANIDVSAWREATQEEKEAYEAEQTKKLEELNNDKEA